jgi:hypothetical protein
MSYEQFSLKVMMEFRDEINRSIVLQPKRWQAADDPKYDPIRHHAWFQRIQKRKHVLPMMEGCLRQVREDRDGSFTQEELCDLWNVSPREFRDYRDFVIGWSREYANPKEKLTYQHILDSSYKAYCIHNAIRPIQSFIQDMAPLYGVPYRPVWERWETDPTFYPTGYAK